MGYFLIPVHFYFLKHLFCSFNLLPHPSPVLVLILWFLLLIIPSLINVILYLVPELSHNAKKTCFSSLTYCYSVSFKLYLSNPVAWVGVWRKMLPASLLRSWEYLQKKQQDCQGSRLWDQGITLLIKKQVALLPMGIQCNTLDWIRWWQPRPFVFCAWRDERNLSSAVLLYTQKHVLRNGCELSMKAMADLKCS